MEKQTMSHDIVESTCDKSFSKRHFSEGVEQVILIVKLM